MMPRSRARYRRRSIRLKNYDYTRAGAYFVTLCTQDRACLFGSVLDGETQLNEYGRKVADCWLWLAEQYPYVHLDEWVVMPNHVHGIIVITDDAHGGRGDPMSGRARAISQRVRQANRSPPRHRRNANHWDV